MTAPPVGLVPVKEILPEVLARIPGLGAYLRQLEAEEEANRGMIVTDFENIPDGDDEAA